MGEKQKLGQEPAFGFSAYTDPKAGNGQNLTHAKREGMSKRFYAACAAMQGFLGNSNYKDTDANKNKVPFIKLCYDLADELLKQENL